MNDFLKIIIPLILVATMTFVYDLNKEVKIIKNTQSTNIKYVIQIQQLKKESDDYESRIRELTKELEIRCK